MKSVGKKLLMRMKTVLKKTESSKRTSTVPTTAAVATPEPAAGPSTTPATVPATTYVTNLICVPYLISPSLFFLIPL